MCACNKITPISGVVGQVVGGESKPPGAVLCEPTDLPEIAFTDKLLVNIFHAKTVQRGGLRAVHNAARQRCGEWQLQVLPARDRLDPGDRRPVVSVIPLPTKEAGFAYG